MLPFTALASLISEMEMFVPHLFLYLLLNRGVDFQALRAGLEDSRLRRWTTTSKDERSHQLNQHELLSEG